MASAQETATQAGVGDYGGVCGCEPAGPVERHRLPYTKTHYFDRLPFNCGLSGHDRGELVLYYENIPGEKFMVYDVRFRNLDAIVEEAERRLTILEAGGPPEEPPTCPQWMSEAELCRFHQAALTSQSLEECDQLELEEDHRVDGGAPQLLVAVSHQGTDEGEVELLFQRR